MRDLIAGKVLNILRSAEKERELPSTPLGGWPRKGGRTCSRAKISTRLCRGISDGEDAFEEWQPANFGEVAGVLRRIDKRATLRSRWNEWIFRGVVFWVGGGVKYLRNYSSRAILISGGIKSSEMFLFLFFFFSFLINVNCSGKNRIDDVSRRWRMR